ncbi:MAG: FemAB family PEP-CTERM system-associated protein [Planctomycetes bacterium]|nr:FemAB family PEP-CTERM system-associated protein [Planctomycetota bacterium]
MKTKLDTETPGPAPDALIEVEAFDPGMAGIWDAYVATRPEATLFHGQRWREVILRTFRHGDRSLVARRGGQVVGVLPLFEVSSFFFGTSLISVPFGVYGGLLVDDRDAARALVEAAGKVARERKAKYVELRHLESPIEDLPATDLYFTFIADVPPDEDGCLQRIPRKGRAEVRKAIADPDLSFAIDELDLKEFHRLFSINKRKLGSPLFPSSLFWHARNIYGEDVSVLSVKRHGETIAAVMSFIHRDTIMPYYSGTAPGAETYRASNYMYYQLMVWASQRGLKHFDFGRSRENTGAYSFKKHQGFEPTQLRYDYILNTATEVPSLNPSNPKYRLAKKAFSSMPIWMAQKLGSWLVKRAPF